MISEKMKKPIWMTAVSVLLVALAACSKESPHRPPEDNAKGRITFTSRGDKITCSPDYNLAIFEKTQGSNYERTDFYRLDIQGEKKYGESESYGVVLQMITTGPLEKGIYPIVDAEDLGSYYYGATNPADPVDVALGIVSDSGSPDRAKDVRSTGGGQLEVSDITLGAYHSGEVEGEAGYRKGFISGTFSFPGTNWEKTATGTCTGKFEHVPIKIYDSE